MRNIAKSFLICLSLSVWATGGNAAVAPEYATNKYTEHSLTRSEKKCIDEGYKITYANCSNQTAPADRCPYHDSYYRSCSQEQWCRNNNYAFLEADCQLPTYPVKMCDNKYPMYRACQEDIDKACRDAGYKSKDECQLTEKRCPYDSDYGQCCDDCPDFAYVLDNVPEGYVAEGETCVTCAGVVKTNVVEAPCDGYMGCKYGPLSPQTPSCLKGEQVLYTACKTPEMVCKEKGFMFSSCQSTEDAEDCPELPNLKKCVVNCRKLAIETFSDADIIAEDIADPELDLTKNKIQSLYGQISPVCVSNVRPEVRLTINDESMAMYSNIFNREISNVNFVVNFETPVTLPINGKLNNVRITVEGNSADIPFEAKTMNINGTVSLVNVANLKADVRIADSAKFITTGNVRGNVVVGKDSSLGIKGNLDGTVKTGSYAEVFIKGILKYKDNANNGPDTESMVFGCNSRTKIVGGLIAETANVVIKQRAVLDTPYVKLISTSNNPDLPNTLSSIHMHSYSKLVSIYDNTEYPLAENGKVNCDDQYIRHLGTAVDTDGQSMMIEPSNRMEDVWQCRSLSYQQQDCDLVEESVD